MKRPPRSFWRSIQAGTLTLALLSPQLGGGIATAEPSATAQALASAPTTAPLHYDGHFGGLRVADIVLTLDTDGNRYKSLMEIDARGVVGLFYTWHGELRASGALADRSRPRPHNFSRSWEDTEDKGATIITYDDATGLAQGIEDGQPQQQVPQALRRGVLDPLAALIALRRLALLEQTGPAVFPVYDGKRRLDLQADFGAPKTVELSGTPRRVIPVEATIDPRAGFSRRQEDGWRATTLHILFSADDEALPVQIRIHSPVGVAVMTLSCAGACA